MNLSRSQKLYARAVRVMPGGVNSPVRAFKSVGGDPPFIARGAGSRIYDEDGNEYIDYVASWGPLILGHANQQVLEPVHAALDRGTSYGASTAAEVDFAEKIVAAVPSVEVVRLVNSGTEAVMSALRVARGFTGRDLVLKFAGGYHGHSDGLLSHAGSGLATLGIPDCPGVPASFAEQTLTAPYNDAGAVREIFAARGGEIAAVILEPVAGNMGVVPPADGFLETLRELTSQHAAVLIFDEVITGFRVHPGGAQTLYGVTPDMSVLGKVLGGGFPLAAYGGKREIMDKIAPVGPVYQAGTLSGNPIAVAAGLATLEVLADTSLYDQLEARGAQLEAGLRSAAQEAGVSVTINRVGSMLTTFFTDRPVHNYEDASSTDIQRFNAYFHQMLERGSYFAPSGFEAGFVSTAHTEADIEMTIAHARESFRAVA